MTRVKQKKQVPAKATAPVTQVQPAAQPAPKKAVAVAAKTTAKPETTKTAAPVANVAQKRKVPAAITKQTDKAVLPAKTTSAQLQDATKRQKVQVANNAPQADKAKEVQHQSRQATAPPSQPSAAATSESKPVPVAAPAPPVEFKAPDVDHLIINKPKTRITDPNIKWFGLEHKGVTFYPRYEPHGKPLLFKGEPIEISPEVEEVCNQWVMVEGSDFAEKDTVVKNFIGSFLALFPKDLGATSLEEFDFKHIREHVERTREQRNARSAEEKRIEKEAQQAIEAQYKFALFNGQLEKTGNAGMEAPGIFRGRGEHPHAGKLKSRIVPEFVTINIGQDAPIPVCHVPGHAWKSVIEKKDGTWLASFRDERSTFLLGKYVQLAAESSVKGQGDMQKYEKARRLKNSIGRIRENYQKQMNSNDRLDNQIGVCTYLIDKLALRVGNEKGEDEADTVGCCSLRCEHIRFDGDNKITLDFLGKDSMRYLNTIEVEPKVYELLEKFSIAKQPGDDIFDMVSASKLNEQLKESMEDLSAKVFRTYNASITLQNELAKSEIDPDKDTVETKVKFYEDCNRKVAILCNHQKSVPKTHEESMAKARQLIVEKQDKLKKLEQLHKGFKSGKELKGFLKTLSQEKGAPKNAEACKAQIDKLKDRIQKDELKMQAREDNKCVALGTSRINYMDPRITISWCKMKDVPIEKIFQSNLQAKFNWAMNNEPTWKF